MQDKRISLSIGADVGKLGELLKSASADRTVLLRLLRQPSAELAKAGIPLDKYGKTGAEKARILHQVDGAITSIITGAIRAKLDGIVASTSSQSSTSSSYEYNFDNSSSSEYKYESHTGTSRGTFSDSSTGSYTDTETGFTGLGMEGLENVLLGPLISPLVIQRIQVAFQKAVAGPQA